MKKLLFTLALLISCGSYAQIQQLGDPLFGDNEYDNLGAGVAISDDGSVIAVSYPGYDGFNFRAGLVRIYNYNNGWVQQGSDIDPGFGYLSEPGWSLDISGDGSVVVLEGYQKNWKAFKFYNNEWIQMGETFTNSDPTIPMHFYGNLSLNYDGTILASGNPFYNSGQGKVIVFSYENDQWNSLGNEILHNDGETLDDQGFGTDVYLNETGSRLAVISNQYSGVDDYVSVYEFDSNSWNQLGSNIFNTQDNGSGPFSISLNNEGNILAVGNPQGISSSCGVCGTVNIYQYDGTDWNTLGNEISSETGTNSGQQTEQYYQFLGSNVSLNGEGNLIAISSNAASMYDDNDLSGLIRLYSFLENQWVNVADISGDWGIHLTQSTPGNWTNSQHHGIGGSLDFSKNGQTIITGAQDNSQLGISYAGMVTVKEITDPCFITPLTVTAPDTVSVSTNDGCTAIEVSLGSSTTSGNCSAVSLINDAPTAFEIGETTVTWTVTDESGNSSTDTQTIVVTDNSNPTVICDELSLTLENGVASISAVDIDNGSYDECGEITLEINQTDFDENNIGDNIIVLTVTDEYGNSSSCETTVTVEAGMGIEDNILANIYLYPNPTSDLVFIAGVDSELNAIVYDLLGKQVMRKNIIKKIDVSLLEKGVYFVKLSNGINNSIHKIIKN